MVYNRLEVGQRLRNMRKDKGYTVEKIAVKMEVSVSHINQIERGSRNMSLDMLFKYLSVLETDPNSILIDKPVNNDENVIEMRLRKLPMQEQNYLRKVIDYMIKSSQKQAG